LSLLDSSECRKAIGYPSLRYTIGFKNSRHFFSQSEVEAKLIVIRSRTVSRAWRQLPQVLIGSLRFLGMSFLIGQSDHSSFDFTTLN